MLKIHNYRNNINAKTRVEMSALGERGGKEEGTNEIPLFFLLGKIS